MGFEPTRALRLKGLANLRNGPGYATPPNTAIIAKLSLFSYPAIVSPQTFPAPAFLRTLPHSRKVAPVVETSSNKINL